MRHALTILAALAVASTAGAAEDLKLQKPVAYPHAGITLALPEGFEFRAIDTPDLVLRAVLTQFDEPAVAVTLQVRRVGPKATPKTEADGMNAQVAREALLIRKFQAVKRTPLEVAGVKGLAERLTYTDRGEAREALRVCFIREIKKPALRLSYILTAETAPRRRLQMLSVFRTVVRSVKLNALRHPSKLPVGPLSPPVRVARKGFSIRPPRGWFVTRTHSGVIMGQHDYLLGATLPSVLLKTKTVSSPAGADAEQAAKADLARAQRTAAARGLAAEVVSQGPAKLAGKDGYGFLFRQQAKPKDKDTPPPPAVFIAQRVICIPPAAGAADEPWRRYTLVLVAQNTTAKAVKVMLAGIASGIELQAPPTTRPATRPAPTTRPAGGPGGT